VYLCAQEKAHRRSGWTDHEPLFVMANTPARDPSEWSGTTWQELKATVWRRLLEAGLMDADDTVVWERNAVGLAEQFPDSLGSIYGAASNDPMAAFRRLPNQDSRVRGLFHAGGSAHPGGGVPLCAMSGRAAAEQLIAERSRSSAVRRLPAGGSI
jgi:1-hydroxycarotenoid 3,4-desaturase